MLDYDRSSWWKTCLSYRGTVLPRVLARVLEVTGFCLALYFFEEALAAGTGRRFPSIDPLIHTVLGVGLSLLIVFRTNASNNRYWEGRSHWGTMVNCARNLVRMGAVLAPPANDLARGVSAYVVAVREHLAGRRDPEAVRAYLLPGEVADAYAANNPPSVLARRLSEWVASRERDGRLNGFQAARMESLVGTLVDAQGGCEKIRNTPITFNYAALIKQMLLIYLFTLPFVLVPRMGAFAPAAMAVLSFGLFGIEEAGVEVEDPFGDDPNDLPLVTITENIAKDVADLAGG